MSLPLRAYSQLRRWPDDAHYFVYTAVGAAVTLVLVSRRDVTA